MFSEACKLPETDVTYTVTHCQKLSNVDVDMSGN